MRFGKLFTAAAFGLFAVSPSSTNYNLRSYDLGGGGGGTGSSTNYQVNGVLGTQNAVDGTSTTYTGETGVAPTINSNVPPAPTLTNPSSYYNRLRLIINTGNNPSDTQFGIAISPDNFVTTQYVKADNSIGSTLTSTDYRTYTSLGAASGILVTGLSANSTYTVKVKAKQGKFSESAYGPTVSAATVLPTLTFSVATSLTATPPFTIGFGSITPGTVVNGNADAVLTLTTNAVQGGRLFVRDENAGLRSTAASYTLPSATADLASAGRGFGAQIIALSQSSGGPLAATSPFGSAGSSVGALTTTFQELASSAAPVTGGSVTVRLKAKADVMVPSQSDYNDTLTFVAAMSF